jgi:hypothetical protein
VRLRDFSSLAIFLSLFFSSSASMLAEEVQGRRNGGKVTGCSEKGKHV